jgi:hypothetical protein
MMSLAENSLCLLWAAFPLQAQDDLPNQALDFMRAGQFHDAEILWRQLEKRDPNNPAVHATWESPWRNKGSWQRLRRNITSR